MVNIYIGKDNLPKNKTFVFDVEGIMPSLDIDKDEISRMIVKDIDDGTVIGSSMYKDAWGVALYSDFLSTTSQLLIAAYQKEDCIFNSDEMGLNGIDMIDKLPSGNFFFSTSDNIPLDLNTPICINNNLCVDTDEVYDIMAEVSWSED